MPAKESLTIDVLVEMPQAGYNRYVYDQGAKSVRLAEVVCESPHHPADWGTIPRTLDADGHPLDVLLLVRQPTFPGCLVAARPIGLVELRTGNAVDRKVVAVAEADHSLIEIKDIGNLPSSWRTEIEVALTAREPDERNVLASWRGAAEAAQLVKNALHADRMARVEAEKVVARPAWKAADLSRSAWGARENDANSDAEHAVSLLPYRFQNYVADCLVPNERILLHLLRAPMTYGNMRFLRRRQAHEGLVVVTDQQLLFMTDAVPPDATLIHWGYVARAVALERLRAVEIIHGESHLRLEAEVEAVEGTERLGFDFPVTAQADLEKVAAILRGFIPRTGERRLRRLPEVQEDRPSFDQVEDKLGAPELVEPLEAWLKEHLADGEFVLSRALAPAWPEKKLGPRLLALTKERLLVISQSRGNAEIYGVRDFSSAELRHSLLGCYLELAMPRNGSVERLVVDFDSPSGSRFTRFFVTARQLLATPTMRDATRGGMKDER